MRILPVTTRRLFPDRRAAYSTSAQSHVTTGLRSNSMKRSMRYRSLKLPGQTNMLRIHCDSETGPAECAGHGQPRKERKQEITYAREAVQAAEDARIMTIRKMKAEDEEHQREASAQAVQQSDQAAQRPLWRHSRKLLGVLRLKPVPLRRKLPRKELEQTRRRLSNRQDRRWIRQSRCVSD